MVIVVVVEIFTTEGISFSAKSAKEPGVFWEIEFVDRFKVKSDSISCQKIKFINHRTLIMWGEYDELIPSEIAYWFHNDLPNDTLVILKNVGHVPMEESPKKSLKAVIEFLKK